MTLSNVNYRSDSYWFQYRAMLRIFGTIENLEEITSSLRVNPTHTHKHGKPFPNSTRFFYKNDMWYYLAPIDSAKPFHYHLRHLYDTFVERFDIIKAYKPLYNVDIYCSFRTNCESGGFSVEHDALKIFTELELPFGVSLVGLPGS